ncbi:serine/threonine protein kinase, partial [Candidatus Sumerlaeota bacterium]|nr:serine/threonine protein kinase [Candidatus Sumerlaeota bacterium]
DLAIGRYQFVDKIGSGGMGVVYKVLDVRQNKQVAMKILRDGLASSSKALDRFFREARIAAQIRHRNIVDIYDYNISSQDGQNYIVMEFIEGQSLREFIDLHFDDTISTSIEYITEMLYYGVQLFDALQATHSKGIIHRDIKPDNIMVTPMGEVKITDFGIAHVEEATFTPTGAMLGTPRYMAPEQVTGQKVDGRSDIYSVGILLYEVLTGSPPFMTGDISYQQVNKQAVEPRLINSVIPQSVNNFILKCLEKKPENRFSSAGEAKLAIAEILSSLGGCKKYENVTSLASTGDSGRGPSGKKEAQPIRPRPARPADVAVADNPDKLELDDLDLD